MSRYVLTRFALAPLVVFLVASATFFFVRLLPGDVVTVLAAEAPQHGNASALRHELGLDESLPRQYAEFILGAAHGDFGRSLYYKHPASEELKQAVPVTAELTLLSILLAVCIGVPLGVVAATHRNGKADHSLRMISVFLQAIPTFWTGTLAITFLGLWFAWTPPLKYTPIWEDPLNNLEQFAIPALVLALGTISLKLRLVRSQLLDVFSQDYIRTARAKGLDNGTIVQRHALRNAMVPVVAIIGNQTGALLGGAAIIESIFNLPGLGRVLLQAVSNRDYPLIQASVLVIALLLVTVNLVTDLVYAWLDPRIHYA